MLLLFYDIKFLIFHSPLHFNLQNVFLPQLQGNLENELEVLGDLKDIFDDMVDNMGDMDLDDR